MEVNWLAYNYRTWDGYGRYSTRLIAALERLGVGIHPGMAEQVNAPDWMHARWGLDWSRLTISCLPPFYLQRAPVEHHWLIAMTEGSELPEGWAEQINACGVERVFVPCELNAQTFRRGGVRAPVSVLPGGTDPDEFPLLNRDRRNYRPYVFLALADRGARKGWGEVYEAFYRAFGGKTTGQRDVLLIIKSRPEVNEVFSLIAKAQDPDPRLICIEQDYDSLADLYAMADVFVIPSRSEGWGMPHREAAMMGVPVITQRYSGMDDGHTDEWAIVVEGGKLERMPSNFTNIAGAWMRADVGKLAQMMRDCYEAPEAAAAFGREAAAWLRAHQTWDHAAARLIAEIETAGLGDAPGPDMSLAALMAADDGCELWR